MYAAALIWNNIVLAVGPNEKVPPNIKNFYANTMAKTIF
jgi:hypothetical protein